LQKWGTQERKAGGKPNEDSSNQASKCANDDKRQNLEPLPLVMERNLEHNQFSVLKRIDPLQRHCSYNGTKKRSPHGFWREE
jgi:hypothetical protein